MEKMVTKTVLITGGLGCLGGRISKYLMNVGYHIIIGSSRQDANLPSELENCSLVYTDFDDVDALADICQNIDCIIHLATVNAQQSQNHPQLAIKVNAIGTHHLLQASIRSNVEYFLYFSTAHIYGSPLIGVIDESTTPKPSHPYATTHRLAENLVLESTTNQTIKGNVIRLSNSIGLPLIKEANCWMLFVNDACKQAIINECITIRSNPDSERDFIPITTVCEVTEYFLSNQPTTDYLEFNLGSGVSHTLLQVAKIIATRCEILFNFCPEIIYSKNNLSQKIGLTYKVDRLVKEIGRTTNNNLVHSIDEVLSFCNTEFSKP